MKIPLILLMVLCVWQVHAQRGIGYQGYARSADGSALTNQKVVVRFGIHLKDETKQKYTEEIKADTDAYGVFHTTFGKGIPAFADLDFAANEYWLKVEAKPLNGTYTELADSKLMAVAYAKTAERAVYSKTDATPPGVVTPFAGNEAAVPVGYLPCDGRSLRKLEYPALFAAIGNTWGGSGTTFKLPDLRGRIPAGADDGKGTDAALTPGSYTNDNLQEHDHYAYFKTDEDKHNHKYKDYFGADNASEFDVVIQDHIAQGDGGALHGYLFKKTDEDTHNHLFIASVKEAGEKEENRPKNVAVWYIIKI